MGEAHPDCSVYCFRDSGCWTVKCAGQGGIAPEAQFSIIKASPPPRLPPVHYSICFTNQMEIYHVGFRGDVCGICKHNCFALCDVSYSL